MVYRKQTLIKLAALLLTTTAAVPMVQDALGREQVLAQTFGETPDAFPIPSSLPEGSTLRVDGSHSMAVTNDILKARFEESFPDINVELNASRTDAAISDLLDGDLDLVASGRPLTDAERADGLVEIPLEREKLAIILGANNPFTGNLSFEQFAQIFRGEITNWSAVGGPDQPIRLVDRPDFSDTRRALSTYEVFQRQPFATGDTAEVIETDETPDVIAQLGDNGIGYAVYSQVDEVEGIKILPMHETLPDDPRYPYSQYRAFVYREDASPAVLAFLGFATTAPGAEVFDETPVVAADPNAAGESAAIGTDTDAEDTAATATGAEPDAAATVAPEADAVSPDADSETALVPGGAAAEETPGGFPWWWLGIPIVGGLLWWALRGLRGGAGAAVAPVATPTAVPVAAPVDAGRLVLTPRSCRDAYAYWDMPRDRDTTTQHLRNQALKLRLYEVTGRAPDAALPPPLAELAWDSADPDMHIPIERDDRDYQAEIGYLTDDQRWTSLATSAPVRVPACPSPDAEPTELGGMAVGAAAVGAMGAAGLATAATRPLASSSRLVLTPRNAHDAYAYWEVPDSHWAELRQQGGQRKVVRLYDVTGRSPDAPLPPATSQFACNGDAPDLHLPLQQGDRDYLAEVGYLTNDDRWLPAATSNAVRVPGPVTGGVADATFPEGQGGGAAALGVAAVGAGAVAAAQRLTDAAPPESATSRIVLTPRNDKKAYAYWEVPETAHTAMQSAGGTDAQLRIYDVTDTDYDVHDIDGQQPPAHSVLTYDIATTDGDRFVPLPAVDRDYVAAVGYCTTDNRWLQLARSQPIRPSTVLAKSSDTLGLAAGVGAATGAAALGAIAAQPVRQPAFNPPTRDRCAIQTVNVHSRHNAVPLDPSQMEHLQTVVAAKHTLETGLCVLRLRDGVFNYDGDDNHPGEPFVLLWIYGGKVINQKTGVPVQATWSTLNGYADTLTLDVHQPAEVCAFFMDTFPDDNVGEVTLSVIQL